MASETIKVFLSSRVNSQFEKEITGYSLKELRQKIKSSLEGESILGTKLIEVIINEDSFNGDFTKDWYQHCLKELQDSHVIIMLYSGEAGWSEEGTNDNGICHEEFILAFSKFSELTYGFDLSDYFDLKPSQEEAEKNQRFADAISDNGMFLESISATTSTSLESKIIKQIHKKLLDTITKSITVLKHQSFSSNIYESTLDWSKLSYSQRAKEMEVMLSECCQNESSFKTVIKQYHAIPDNMSVADARNRINRPFLEEYTLLDDYPKLKKGIIHFIAVYGSATEIQAKNLVGYPDLTVIKTPFGFYLWDKIRHIQLFFLSKCINREKIRSKILEVRNWIKASRELDNILRRAEGRYQINQTIKKVQKYADD